MSCKSKKASISDKVEDCVKAYVTKKRQLIGGGEKITLEQTFVVFENFLLKEGYLEKIDKESYLNLITMMLQNPNAYKEIYDHIVDPKIYNSQDFIMDPVLMLTQCPYFVLVTEKNDFGSTLNLQYEISQRIIQTDYSDLDLIKELLANTTHDKFNELIYRMPVIYVVLMNAGKTQKS